MPYAYLILPAIVCCGLIAGWILARALERRYYRGKQGSSEEILDGLELAYTPRRGIEIRTPTEYLPFVFGCILENVDSGFEDRQVRHLLDRTKLVSEPSGAITAAAVLAGLVRPSGKTVVVLSGGNIEWSGLRTLLGT